MDKFVSRQSYYLIVPRVEDYLLCDRVWFFLLRVDYSILRDSTSTTAGTSYFPYIFMALPVCLASFGFHGNIPSLIICYGKRKDKLIKSVVFGSLLALVIYLFWLYCTMGNIPRESFKAIISSGGNVDSLVKSFLGTKQHGIIEFCLLVFSNLAVASSFLVSRWDCSIIWRICLRLITPTPGVSKPCC